MPTYTVKCRGCKYSADLFLLWSEFEKYLKENKCPKCKKDLFNDIASNMGNFIMNADEKKRRDKRALPSLEKARDKSVHNNKIHKDPYYDVR